MPETIQVELTVIGAHCLACDKSVTSLGLEEFVAEHNKPSHDLWFDVTMPDHPLPFSIQIKEATVESVKRTLEAKQ